MTKTFDVHKMHEVAIALVAATSTMLKADQDEIQAEDGFDAIEQVLKNHPEIDILEGWIIGTCLSELRNV